MLNQEQWYEKIRVWVPRWFWEQEKYSAPLFKAIAALLAQIDAAGKAHVDQTYILRAKGQYIDIQGDERTIPRGNLEPDPIYAKRVQQIINQSDRPDLKTLVDALLITGQCIIYEHYVDGPYNNRGTFLNRRFIFNDRRYYNYFTVLIPPQNPISNSFASRDAYCNRGNFLGDSGLISSAVLLASINAVINSNRAGGIFYRLIEQ